ncbi:MAG: 16S rRNA (guanine(527)-N(7))-methyltransferase RsmG, partial [Idiomarina sp.]|nr:16S rRNA (guanine(527)-N(7))-methyltransferase RsmG [Idiomarina sp.]
MKHAVPDAQVLRKQLVALIDQTSLRVTGHQIDQLIALVLLLNKWNKAYNLTSVRDPSQMLVRHIMDSILVAPYVTGNQVVDVGTGPGLPGLPLAI